MDITEILKYLAEVGLIVKLTKCKFLQDSIRILDYDVDLEKSSSQ